MPLRIALAGNPNCGKTTLFNFLTGSNQFVGNWPGVTVEKKEGRLKGRDDVIIADLPGIYSLSPYTLEEVVARNYLIDEHPDVILNVVDGTNIERNLYLTTQLCELGIPVVIAINMMDVLRKNGDKINVEAISRALNCKIVEISALKGTGVFEAAEAAIEAVDQKIKAPTHIFSGAVEHALAHIEEAAVHNLAQEQQRWYAIKIFERDERVLEKLNIDSARMQHIESDIISCEREMDDDAESIITNERYLYVARVLKGNYTKKRIDHSSISDKIDKVVTNRFLALPIFALVMFLVYFISVTTVGTWLSDFTNDGLFGEGWHLFGIDGEYDEAIAEHSAPIWNDAELYSTLTSAAENGVPGSEAILESIDKKDFAALVGAYDSFGATLEKHGYSIDKYLSVYLQNAPSGADYGIWVPGIGVLIENALAEIDCWPWLTALVVDGIVGGVGAVLGFVPQIFVLFIILSFLEACGYMSRIAFVLDKIFRKIGLSGKSFIPLLIGTGCSVPGIMSSRTIENERDRRMTIITTSFVPCGAKLPMIALISTALFGGAWWLAPIAYFVGVAAVVVSGIILKKTKRFSGDPSPFVMELPAYHMPSLLNVLRSSWDRCWSFIKKAGTIILLSTIFIWAGSHFGYIDGGYVFDPEMTLTDSILGGIGASLGWLFIPLGFARIETAIATVMGILAKEEIVAVLGVLKFTDMTKLSAFSFMTFNLLCAPCVAAIGAIKREMNNTRWTIFAIGYQCLFAYAVSFVIYQIGSLFSQTVTPWNAAGAVIAIGVIAFGIYMMARPYQYEKSQQSE